MGTTSSGGFELLLLGGRAGVGKTSVAAEVSLLLREAGVTHCHIEGDVLDAAQPKPPEGPDGSGMTERNLRSLAGEYRRLGYRRLVYVNTVSVVEPDLVRRAVGEVRSTVSVLLEADNPTVQARLSSRERGSELPAYLARGPAMAQALDNEAGADVHRLDVSNSSVREAAERVLDLTGWLLGPDDDVEPVHEPARLSEDVVLDEAVLSLVGRDDEAAVAAVAEFLTGSDWPFHTGGRPTRDEVVARVRSGHYDADGTATFLVRESGRAVALVRLSDLDDDTAMFDLRVADAERSRGLGTRVVRWSTGHVFSTHPSVLRVEATTRHDNTAMRHVLGRCGYVQESLYRASWPDADGTLLDAVGYAVIRQDWEAGLLGGPAAADTPSPGPALSAWTSTVAGSERELLLRSCLDAFDELVSLVSAMDDASANWRPDRPGANSVVALLVHSCGMARRWSSTVNLGGDLPRDRDAEFTARMPVADALRLAAATRAAFALDVRATDPAAVPAAVPLGREDYWTGSCRGVLLHVLQELRQHLGQAEITRDERAAR